MALLQEVRLELFVRFWALPTGRQFSFHQRISGLAHIENILKSGQLINGDSN